ncbi:TPA: fimbrial protein [Escherichia coli]|nr:fimbrial protein [Escherichia coli]HEL8550154.1 fimbrial protein [Escherichia coli]HEM0025826.1 fimbrial protein [Escherichia coli]
MRTTVFLLIFLSFLSDLWAVDVPVNITGTIIIPPCQINNSNSVNVDFGNVRVSELDTKEHIKVVSFPIYCPYHQGKAYVKMTGQSMAGKDNILATNIDGLGIELYQGEGTGNHLILGRGSSEYGYEIINALSDKNVEKTTFTFTAKIYKIKDVIVNSGAFEASALIDIVYL